MVNSNKRPQLPLWGFLFFFSFLNKRKEKIEIEKEETNKNSHNTIFANFVFSIDFSIPGSSDLFGYIPSETNYVYPGKRPLSSITPVIVERRNGTLALITGSAGGSRIITATVQNVIHSIDEGLSAADALAKPRLHDQLVPNQVTFEYNYDNVTVAFMKSLGHNVSWVAPGQSNAQLVKVLPNGTFDAAGEPRQVNSAGYSI